jgi:hypothetical protein
LGFLNLSTNKNKLPWSDDWNVVSVWYEFHWGCAAIPLLEKATALVGRSDLVPALLLQDTLLHWSR